MTFPLQTLRDLIASKAIYSIEGVGHVVAINSGSATVATSQGMQTLATSNLVRIGDQVAVANGMASTLPPSSMAIEV